MLFEMLFGGLLLNKESIGTGVKWANSWSFWNHAWEGLLVNEVNGLTLVDQRLGLDIIVSFHWHRLTVLIFWC